MAGCGSQRGVRGRRFLAREGETADRFYVVRQGKVALELHTPTGPLLIETLGAGELVGWSWLFPPYRWTFDVEAIDQTRVTTIESACLRAKCESDPAFGYRLMQRFAQVIVDRLQATRFRLLDLYGNADAS